MFAEHSMAISHFEVLGGGGKKEIDFAAVSIREGCPMPDGCGARSNTDIREFFYRY